LISNEPLYLRHFASIFEELWKNGIGADDRIRHIEERVDSAVIELVPNPKGDSKSVEQHKSCNRRSINSVFFGKRTLRRQIRMGGLQLLMPQNDMGQNSEIAPRLFTKFTTTSDVGTGLGLY
jgi:two-component system, OmpR family, sensor histidine kinase VicK